MMNSVVSENESFPMAKRQRINRVGALWWILPIVSVITCLSLFFYSQRHSGVYVNIEFRDGHGIKPQDVLKHKGIVVGEVERVELSPDLDKVVAKVRLAASARRLAKEGSRFWIVRPNISIDSIGGLDTIVGAKYLAVAPGPANAQENFNFVGLDVAPIVAPKTGSLEIILDSPHRSGLMPNAPILFRGYSIGRVVDLGLASDARSVRARCAIDPEYKNLVRTDSKFWKQTGWKLNIGLTGVKIDAETLPQLLTGSIEMATPPTQGVPITNGSSFVLHAEAEREWLQWSPGISGVESGFNDVLPVPVQLTKNWEQSWLGFTTKKQTTSWCIVMEDGSLLGCDSQFTKPSQAIDESCRLQIADQFFDVEAITRRALGGIHANDGVVLASLPEFVSPSSQRWPIKRLTLATSNAAVKNIIIVQQPVQASVWVDAARLTKVAQAWQIDSSVLISADMTGLPVVDAESKDVLGTLVYDADRKAGTVLLIDTAKVGQ